jgi:iron-sulfur cluster assembly protein
MAPLKRRFQVITMTDAATARVREILESAAGAGQQAQGIRVGVKKGGCAGMEYTVSLVTEPNPADDVVEADGARVYVDPAAALFLLGTRMDYEVTKLRSGFIFQNPNQTSACGCGESVELKPADRSRLEQHEDA